MVVSFRWAVVAFLSFRAGSAFQNGCRRSRVSTVSFSKSTHLPYTGEDLERAKRWQNEWREAQESGKFEDLSSDREAYAYSNRRQYQMSSLADQTFATADERRSEEEWNIKMRVARAAATAVTDILSSATIAAIATADATIGKGAVSGRIRPLHAIV